MARCASSPAPVKACPQCSHVHWRRMLCLSCVFLAGAPGSWAGCFSDRCCAASSQWGSVQLGRGPCGFCHGGPGQRAVDSAVRHPKQTQENAVRLRGARVDPHQLVKWEAASLPCYAAVAISAHSHSHSIIALQNPTAVALSLILAQPVLRLHKPARGEPNDNGEAR